MRVPVTVPEARHGGAGARAAGVLGDSGRRAPFAFGGVAPAPRESGGHVGAPHVE